MEARVADLVERSGSVGMTSNADCVMFKSGPGNGVVALGMKADESGGMGLGLLVEGGCAAGESVEVIDGAD
jgi:hypothetical protein